MAKIFIASDHAGFLMKQYLIREFSGNTEHEIFDHGTYDNTPCDYPIFTNRVVNEILNNEDSYGILICGTGIGMSIAANRYKGIRAALCCNGKMAEMARRHNDANVIVFGATQIDKEIAKRCVNIFLATGFDCGKYERRLSLINELTNGD